MSWRWPRGTSTGIIYVIFLFLVSGAAVNTGNNTLYLTATTMMGILIFSGILSTLALSSVAFDSLHYDEIFAGQPAAIQITLKNRSRWFSLQGLHVNGQPLPPLRRNSTKEYKIMTSFPRRGRVEELSLVFMSSYPFGFFRREKTITVHESLIVFPAPIPWEKCHSLRWRGEGPLNRTSNLSGERRFRSLKQFNPGDDPRSIHWKKTAQRQKLIVKEYTYHQTGNNIFLLPGDMPPAEFDTMISRVAFCLLSMWRRGNEAGLKHGEHLFEPGRGYGHRQRVLTYLALLPS